MKKIISIIVLGILSACSEEFLEIYPETTLNENNFYQTGEDFIILANGLYTPMRDYERDEHWIFAELISDNTRSQNSSNPGSFRTKVVVDLFQVTAEVGTYQSFWNDSYNGIYRCNKLLAEIDRPGVAWSKESFRARSAGEALFLRGLYYFNLVRQFGGVPLVLDPILSQEAVGVKRSSQDLVYESIINDLIQAADQFSNAMDVEEDGRANWGAAMALLGKVYLTRQMYNEAETALQAVINSGRYSLLPNYADLFDPANPDFQETIFSIQYSEANNELANRFIFMFAPITSGGEVTQRPNININTAAGGFNQPTDDLINAFEPNDIRKDVSIKFWTGPDTDGQVRDIPYSGKFKPPVSSPVDRCSDNMPILRYSDVLLMYAEVLNELGRTGEAIPYVEQVRERAGLADPLTDYNQESLRILIANERQVEFCFENQRWYDLKRTGKALEVMTAHGQYEIANKSYVDPGSYQITPDKLLAPIPILEVELNQLEQNPGY